MKINKKALLTIIAGCFLVNSAVGQESNDIREIILNCVVITVFLRTLLSSMVKNKNTWRFN